VRLESGCDGSSAPVDAKGGGDTGGIYMRGCVVCENEDMVLKTLQDSVATNW